MNCLVESLAQNLTPVIGKEMVILMKICFSFLPPSYCLSTPSVAVKGNYYQTPKASENSLYFYWSLLKSKQGRMELHARAQTTSSKTSLQTPLLSKPQPPGRGFCKFLLATLLQNSPVLSLPKVSPVFIPLPPKTSTSLISFLLKDFKGEKWRGMFKTFPAIQHHCHIQALPRNHFTIAFLEIRFYCSLENGLEKKNQKHNNWSFTKNNLR